MLSLFFGTISAFLAVRQCLIVSYRKCSFFSLLIILCFSAVAWIAAPQAIASFSLEHFLWLVSFLILSIGYDLYRLKKNSFKPSPIRVFLSVVFFLLSMLYLSCLKLPYLYTSDPILQLHTTKEEKQEIVTWKTPNGVLQTQSITAHRVIIENRQGVLVFDGYLYGDLASIRLKLMSFPKWMHWMGFPYLWQADTISSDYLIAERKADLPHHFFALDADSKSIWNKVVWGFWQKAFFLQKNNIGIRLSSLASTYIPLVNLEGSSIAHSYTIELCSIDCNPSIQSIPYETPN
ncbi:MAG: hypothetical protein NTZ52_06820 [Chlamydiae bacterium]|nr:hypothetical protein [Chlamydiota bacterium]